MSALDRLHGLPDWPGRMTAPVAAAYMGISTSSFLTRFKDIGVREGANLLWARAQLDSVIAAQFGIAVRAWSPPPEDRDTSWDDFE